MLPKRRLPLLVLVLALSTFLSFTLWIHFKPLLFYNKATRTGFILNLIEKTTAAFPKPYSESITTDSATDQAAVKRHRLADACIIGARKTGTATIQRFLQLNPRISTRTNETWFFDFDSNYNQGTDHYANMLPAAYDDQIILDTTPRYFITEEVPSRIKKVNPNMKLILSLRDPVVRLISEYTHNRFFGDKRRPEVNHTLDQMVFYKNGSINTTYPPLDSSIYIKYFRRWRQYFDMDQIYIVDGDRFVHHPVSILNQIERFLEIPSVISRFNLVFSKKKGFYCLRKGMKLKCMNGDKGRRHPHVSTETLQKLYTFYEPYNKEFLEYTGLNFTWHMKH